MGTVVGDLLRENMDPLFHFYKLCKQSMYIHVPAAFSNFFRSSGVVAFCPHIDVTG